MDASWIFDAPPPPPSPSETTPSAFSKRGRGNTRGQKRKRNGGHGHDLNDHVFKPAMSFDTGYSMPYVHNNAATTSSKLGPDMANKAYEIGEDPPIEYQPPRHKRNVAEILEPITGPIQYNDAGYALSSTYNAAQQSTFDTQKIASLSCKIPPPKIHGTNISLDTPEDIAAWIAERKKKWPSTTNIEKKVAQEPAKARSGSKSLHKDSLTTKDSTKNVKNVPMSITTDSSGNAVESNGSNRSVEVPKACASSLDIALAALSGSIESEQIVDTVPTKQILTVDIVPQLQAGTHATLPSSDSSDASDSDSDSASISGSDDDDDEPKAISSKLESSAMPAQDSSVSALPSPSTKRRVCKYFRQGRCNRGEACTYLHDASQAKNGAASDSKKGPGKQNVDDRYKWRKRKSLYERLVEQELEQEQEQEKLRAENEAKEKASSA